jgi:multiple sugar transport system substrate-binding protein
MCAAALALTGALSGCGRDSGGGGSEKAKDVSGGKAKGDIVVWAMGTEGEKLPELAKEFEQENPDAKVKITPFPWDAAHDKVANAIAGGETPDVSLLGTTWMGEFATTKDALDPTPDLIDKDTFFPGAWDSTVVNDTSYGVPWYVETRLIYYRKDIAQKAGVQPPTNQADLKAFAEAMKAKGGARWGIYLQPGKQGSWQTFMPFAWQNGAELTSDGDKKFNLDSDEIAKSLDYYKSFFQSGVAAKDLEPEQAEQAFIDGQLAAMPSGPWHLGIFKEKGGPGFLDKVGLAVMPKEKSGTSFIGGGNLAVFKNSKNRDSAWKFVSFLSKAQTQAKWYQTSTDLPAVKGAWDDPALTADPNIATFGTQLDDVQAPPSVPNWEQVATELDGEIEKVCKTDLTGADAAKAMQEKAEKIGTGL